MEQDAAKKPTDPLAEIEAMKQIAEQLGELDVNAVKRVLKWAGERFLGGGSTFQTQESAHSSFPSGGALSASPTVDVGIAEFFARAHPSSQAECALVVGYWLQVQEGQGDFEAQRVNNELKHLGHGVGNITMAFNDLMRQRPQLVIQTKKTGSARQARKKYRLTHEGIRKVQQMLVGEVNGDEDV